jgi:hypothetical protein
MLTCFAQDVSKVPTELDGVRVFRGVRDLDADLVGAISDRDGPTRVRELRKQVRNRRVVIHHEAS